MSTPKIVHGYLGRDNLDMLVWEDGNVAAYLPENGKWVALPRADYATLFPPTEPIPVADAPEPTAVWHTPEVWACRLSHLIGGDVPECPRCGNPRPIFAIAERFYPDGTPCK